MSSKPESGDGRAYTYAGKESIGLELASTSLGTIHHVSPALKRLDRRGVSDVSWSVQPVLTT